MYEAFSIGLLLVTLSASHNHIPTMMKQLARTFLRHLASLVLGRYWATPARAVVRQHRSSHGPTHLWCLIWQTLVVTSVGIMVTGGSAQAQLSDRVIAPSGLEIHWEGNLGGAGLARADQSLVMWAHQVERREYVDVFLGNRLIERIDARQVDKAALDRLILEGKPSKPAPVLGMQGAQARAAKLVKTYAIVGRTLTVKQFSEPVIYVVGLASNGILSAFDGESGEVLWQTSLPRGDLTLLGPGVSDDFVTVINGNAYYVMSLKDGNLVTTRRLEFTATAAPVPLQDRILVPSIAGRLVAYDIAHPELAPVVLSGGTENRNGVAISANRDYLAWCSQSSLFIVHNEKRPVMWSRVNVGEPAESRPLATPQGFVFSSNDGTVVHASTNRTGSFLWRTNTARQTSRPPVIGNNRVFSLSDDGQVRALDLQTGAFLWPTPTKNVSSILGVGKEHLYVRDTSGLLASVRLSDGKFTNRTKALLQGVVPNSVNDRFFVVTRDGHVTCLREQGAVQPTMYVEMAEADATLKMDTAPKRREPEAPTRPADDDPFRMESAGNPPAQGETKDPFDPF